MLIDHIGVAGVAIYEQLKNAKRQWLALLPLALVPATLLVNFTPFEVHGHQIARVAVALYAVAAFILARFLPKIDGEEARSLNFLRKIISVLAILTLLALAELFSTDYGNFGVGLIFLLYLANPANRATRTVVLAVAMAYFYGQNVLQSFWNYVDGQWIVVERVVSQRGAFMFGFSLIAVVLVLLYNGKVGLNTKPVKWGFYFFYPVHIALLFAVRLVM